MSKLTKQYQSKHIMTNMEVKKKKTEEKNPKVKILWKLIEKEFILFLVISLLNN